MSTKNDPLFRFTDAQAPVYSDVVAELKAGDKVSHWMWFVFPQLRGLGRSATAQHYGLTGSEEAMAYSRHPVLGARLKECCEIILALDGRSAQQIFGGIDAMKLKSSMTLFAAAVPDPAIFLAVLKKYYRGEQDSATLDLLA